MAEAQDGAGGLVTRLALPGARHHPSPARRPRSQHCDATGAARALSPGGEDPAVPPGWPGGGSPSRGWGNGPKFGPEGGAVDVAVRCRSKLAATGESCGRPPSLGRGRGRGDESTGVVSGSGSSRPRAGAGSGLVAAVAPQAPSSAPGFPASGPGPGSGQPGPSASSPPPTAGSESCCGASSLASAEAVPAAARAEARACASGPCSSWARSWRAKEGLRTCGREA